MTSKQDTGSDGINYRRFVKAEAEIRDLRLRLASLKIELLSSKEPKNVIYSNKREGLNRTRPELFHEESALENKISELEEHLMTTRKTESFSIEALEIERDKQSASQNEPQETSERRFRSKGIESMTIALLAGLFISLVTDAILDETLFFRIIVFVGVTVAVYAIVFRILSEGPLLPKR